MLCICRLSRCCCSSSAQTGCANSKLSYFRCPGRPSASGGNNTYACLRPRCVVQSRLNLSFICKDAPFIKMLLFFFFLPYHCCFLSPNLFFGNLFYVFHIFNFHLLSYPLCQEFLFQIKCDPVVSCPNWKSHFCF